MKRTAILLVLLILAPALVATLALGHGRAASPDGTTVIPDEVMQIVAEAFPEKSNGGAAFVSDVFSPTMTIVQPCTIDAIFLWEGAGFENTIGYYTFQENPDGSITILDRNLIFPNLSFPPKGTMATGDTLTLRNADGTFRTFQPGEHVGFFLVADGWRTEPLVQSWDPLTAPLPAETPRPNLDFGRGCFTSIPQLNPEFAQGAPDLSQHVAMLGVPGIPGFLGGNDFFVFGFEDLNRAISADDDFNDAIGLIVPSPFDAAVADVLPFNPSDLDGDGIGGTNDAYPNDATRAFVTRYPTHGQMVWSLEDNYPNLGDADFNDAVVAGSFQVVTDAAGNVKDILGTFHLVARGANFDHRFGLHIPGLPADATGTVRIERFSAAEGVPSTFDPDRTVADILADGKRLADIFPSTQTALPPVSGTFTNTTNEAPERPAASVAFLMQFDQAIAPGKLGAIPFDPYFSVFRNGEEWDVHLPGNPGFSDRPASLPLESGSKSFLDGNGFPWMLEIPTTWRFPLEHVAISTAYPEFDLWRTSKGETNVDWYLHPAASANTVSLPLTDTLPVRDWGLTLPTP